LTDVVAYRITVEDVKTCYEVLGLIHSIYKAIPGRFKDYISNPKPNGYQSLHTSVIGPYGNREEIQIRTTDMHEIAESGVAAHWVYKQAGKPVKAEDKEGAQYKWLKSLVELLQDTDDPDEFREKTRLDLFGDQVFVYTPKGDLVSMPKGATPLDFAYDVHSDVGHKCQSAKVNGRIVPLRTKLQNGDVVEIITNKAQKPTPGWREFVVTAKARNAINRYLRAQAIEEQTLLGKDMLDKASKRDGVKLTEKDLQATLHTLEADNIPDLYVALAQGRIFPKQVLDIVAPERNKPQVSDDVPVVGTLKTPTQTESADDGAVLIDGFSAGMAMHMAGCCNPIPGEPIVGIINTGHGVTIHTRYCRNLDQFADHPERWLSVKWNSKVLKEGPANFTARLRISMFNRAGAMSELTTALFNLGVNISDFRIESKAADYYDVRCDVDVKNLDHFRQMMTAVKALKSVNHVERIQS
jgi:GTP pyrophosphokinase